MRQEATLTLLELNQLVRLVIESELPNEYWVEAELSECRESRGHCYMELIQKEAQTNTPVARASAKCWRQTWAMTRPYFERTTGQVLRAGLKVRLKVYAQFHEAYGFSWIVTDIDPTFTMGDMARRRREIINQLKEEGVFDLQKELALPLFCQRIAVVSSQTAAGYGDFCNQLADNAQGFAFQTQLFPAIMQGEQVEASIIAALNNIFHQADQFDAVVIIRGGGGTADLSGFDTLALAENVANFPLPVITGIGHDRDESILDMISHTRVKTPTAAAAFLISHLQQTLDRIDDAQERITNFADKFILGLQTRIATLQARIPAAALGIIARQQQLTSLQQKRLAAAIPAHLQATRHKLELLEHRLPPLTERKLTAERHRLELFAQRLQALDPALLLRRGYSITLKDGKAVCSPEQLKRGDTIETKLEKGTIKSTII